MYPVEVRLSESYLNELVSGEKTYVYCKELSRNIYIDPSGLSDVGAAIRQTLHDRINKYDKTLGGIFLGYSNLKLNKSNGFIFNDDSFIHIGITAKFYTFIPEVGSILTGVVTKASKNHVGCLVHKVFNASVIKTSEQDDWAGHYVQTGQEIQFEVTVLQMNGPLPYIRGKFSEVPSNQNMEVDEMGVEEKDKKKKKKKKKKLTLEVSIEDYTTHSEKKKKKHCSVNTEMQKGNHSKHVNTVDVPVVNEFASPMSSSVKRKRNDYEDDTDDFEPSNKQKKKKSKTEKMPSELSHQNELNFLCAVDRNASTISTAKKDEDCNETSKLPPTKQKKIKKISVEKNNGATVVLSTVSYKNNIEIDKTDDNQLKDSAVFSEHSTSTLEQHTKEKNVLTKKSKHKKVTKNAERETINKLGKDDSVHQDKISHLSPSKRKKMKMKTTEENISSFEPISDVTINKHAEDKLEVKNLYEINEMAGCDFDVPNDSVIAFTESSTSILGKEGKKLTKAEIASDKNNKQLFESMARQIIDKHGDSLKEPKLSQISPTKKKKNKKTSGEKFEVSGEPDVCTMPPSKIKTKKNKKKKEEPYQLLNASSENNIEDRKTASIVPLIKHKKSKKGDELESGNSLPSPAKNDKIAADFGLDTRVLDTLLAHTRSLFKDHASLINNNVIDKKQTSTKNKIKQINKKNEISAKDTSEILSVTQDMWNSETNDTINRDVGYVSEKISLISAAKNKKTIKEVQNSKLGVVTDLVNSANTSEEDHLKQLKDNITSNFYSEIKSQEQENGNKGERKKKRSSKQDKSLLSSGPKEHTLEEKNLKQMAADNFDPDLRSPERQSDNERARKKKRSSKHDESSPSSGPKEHTLEEKNLKQMADNFNTDIRSPERQSDNERARKKKRSSKHKESSPSSRLKEHTFEENNLKSMVANLGLDINSPKHQNDTEEARKNKQSSRHDKSPSKPRGHSNETESDNGVIASTSAFTQDQNLHESKLLEISLQKLSELSRFSSDRLPPSPKKQKRVSPKKYPDNKEESNESKLVTLKSPSPKVSASSKTCSLQLTPEPLHQLISAEQDETEEDNLAGIFNTPEYFNSNSMVNAEDRVSSKSRRRSILSLNKPTTPLPAAAKLNEESNICSPPKDTHITRGRGLEGISGLLASDDDDNVDDSVASNDVAASKVGVLRSADELKDLTSRLLSMVSDFSQASSQDKNEGKEISSEASGALQSDKLAAGIKQKEKINKPIVRQSKLSSIKTEKPAKLSDKNKEKQKKTGTKEHKKHTKKKKKKNSESGSDFKSDTNEVDKIRELLLKSCLSRFEGE